MEVTLNDISETMKLVREVCDRWDEPKAWREHLLQGACRLLNGNVGMILTDDAATPGWFGRLSVISLVGLPESVQAMVQPSMQLMDQRKIDDVSDNLMPGMMILNEQMHRQGWVTTAANQYLDQAEYHSSPMYLNFRKQMDCDDFVVSIRVVDFPKRPEAIGIDRPHGAQPFGQREVTLLKLLHDEVAPLVGVRLTTEAHLCRDGLSKRLRETLALLLEGHSEKQVAAAMQLHVRTVHDYVTLLYRHFQVSSRAELMAYFVRRKPAFRAAN
jgi:DNA-binding CsgD family transcriptional regulator